MDLVKAVRNSSKPERNWTVRHGRSQRSACSTQHLRLIRGMQSRQELHKAPRSRSILFVKGKAQSSACTALTEISAMSRSFAMMVSAQLGLIIATAVVALLDSIHSKEQVRLLPLRPLDRWRPAMPGTMSSCTQAYCRPRTCSPGVSIGHFHATCELS
jgi:hypothetical protein